ncbi:hypothetical protein BISA_0049 [Bifidobacterium saguini DSM 23967]|uniref:Uncharacterized protein n=3 Tax=Bifidobacterium TaxID=1678 RepID=A0A2N5IS49_9BIFI|nr:MULTISPECIES: hypothetical protein [Bifidobacterium]KFI94014.1 hypothetical protein BISA_0049 [Bifidobacterium saguini DSM 23967]PLS24784.1 hypothetical protein Tam1G_1112 [Bifidobacterium imperatoris]QSY57995.1 hypothetical protein BLI708_01300 [Bifidobacterium imperatoris]QTB90327.1 hypothetical protein BSD967_08280 [Bifidobacterium saguini]
MTGKTQGLSRQFLLTLRRCLTVYGVVLAVGLLLFVPLCYQSVMLGYTGSSAIVFPGINDVELYFRPILLFTAMAWQWFFFDSALCHGVSRKSYMKATAISAAVVPLLLSVLYLMARFVVIATGTAICYEKSDGCRITGPFYAHLSEQFMYAWERMDWNRAPSMWEAQYSPALPAGPLFVGLKFFSLMLSYTAIGALIGAVLAWLARRGIWAVSIGVVVLWYAAQQLSSSPSMLIYMPKMQVISNFYELGTAQNRLVQAMSGRVVSYTADGVEIGTYVVWIPLAESLVLFVLCMWIIWMFTKRREIHPARQRG